MQSNIILLTHKVEMGIYMLILETITMEKIWGTPRLHEYNGDPSVEKIGSVYSVTATEELSNSIREGKWKGETFFNVVKTEPTLFGLKKEEEYPVIISLTAADENLSIQVHPTDEYARRNENKMYGKNESWYFISAPTGGWIFAGSKEINKENIRDKISAGKFEEVVQKKEVKQEDLIYIPSGTLHALTKGSLVYEIQQSTDITYRFYDYKRKDKNGKERPLHLEKALGTLQPQQNVTSILFTNNETKKENPYSLEKIKDISKWKNEEKVAQAITILSNGTSINGENVRKGESVIVFPQETVSFHQMKEAIVATPHLYWRK